MVVLDKTGREIMPGDILKVFHFVDNRRRRRFMYKQVLERVVRGKDETPYLKISHLTFNPNEYYWLLCDGRIAATYEIVQSIDAKFEDRPRKEQG